MDPRDNDDEGKVRELLEQCSDESLLKLATNTHAIASKPSDSLALHLDSDLLARFQRLKAPPPPPPSPLHRQTTAVPSHQTLASTTYHHPHRSLISPASAGPADADVDILGCDLAARLAALKASPSPASPAPRSAASDRTETVVLSKTRKVSSLEDPSLSRAKEEREGLNIDASEVEKLLASGSDEVTLEKMGASGNNQNLPAHCGALGDSDEEISDSEVDLIVEWAKDAVRLDPLEEEEEEEEEEEAGGGGGGGGDPASDGELPTTPATVDAAKKQTGKRWKLW